MKNESKLEQLQIIVTRINLNFDTLSRFNMADLPNWWKGLEETALGIVDDLRIALPLAAEVQPLMVEAIINLKEAVVNMRIDSFNRMKEV